MDIPTIGGARGIFEIFIPGIFLLLNFGIVTYLLPYLDQETKDLIASISQNTIVELVIAICFGYLIGILLRLLKTDNVDRVSSWWLRNFDKKARIEQSHKETWINRIRFWVKSFFSKEIHKNPQKYYKLYAIEEFPYIGWLEHVTKNYLPPEAFEFYKKVWAGRRRSDNRQNKQFFNFCKIVVTANDERAANEIYAAESLTRYIAGMFYALLTASILILFSFFFIGILSGEWMAGLLLLLLTYAIALLIIVQRFRKMRIREVEVVFATSYKNRKVFDENGKAAEE